MNGRRLAGAAVATVLLATVPLPAAADTTPVVTVCATCAVRTPQAGLRLLPPGGTLRVEAGRYAGPLVVDRPVHLLGVGGPVIDGGENGTVVHLTAAGSSLEGFTVRAGGSNLDHEDTGIAVDAPGTTVRGNRVEDVLFGIYVKGAAHALIEGNTVSGKPLPVAERGDGIRVWYSPAVTIDGNTVRAVRDNLVQFSTGCTISRNHLIDDRYGLHFMFSDHCSITDNVGDGNSVGAYLMYSSWLTLARNVFRDSEGTSGYGIALRSCDAVTATGNLLVHNRIGLSLFESPDNTTQPDRFTGNVFGYNGVGLSTGSDAHSDIVAGNDFIDNVQQAGADGEGSLAGVTWAQSGRGNYWSDYSGYDAKADGVGDIPYSPTGTFENLAAANPDFQLLDLSPAAKALDWAANTFPVFGGQATFQDPDPLTRPVATSAAPPKHPVRLPLLAGCASLALFGLVMVGGLQRPGRTGRSRYPARPGDEGKESTMTLAAPVVDRPEPDRSPGTPPSPVPSPLPAANPARAAVSVTGLRKAYGETVIIDQLSFQVGPGEAVALWGENGAGKTTVLRCLLGLVRCGGEIRVGGRSTRTHRREAMAALGHVSQEPAFHGDLTVAETVALYRRLRGAERTEDERVLGTVGLQDAAGKRVSALSGGMRRKLAVAVALLGRPRLLLLDEPTANLDRRSRRELVDLLRRLKSSGIAMILATHQPDEVAALADRVLRLEIGAPASEMDLALFGDAAGAGQCALMVPRTSRMQATRALLDAGIPVAAVNGEPEEAGA